MKKTSTVACLFFLVCFVLFSDVHAMAPVTIAISCPDCSEGRRSGDSVCSPRFAMRKLHIVKMGTRLMVLFCLPLGLLQATVGIPFNLFSDGVRNSITGAVAPINLLIDIFTSASGILQPYHQSRLNLVI